MSDTFTALVLRETDDGHVGALEQLTDADLPDGDVTIDVDYSSLNYKDGMALAGQGRIVRSYPMVPGIDLTGTVVASDSPDFAGRRRGHLDGLGCRRTVLGWIHAAPAGAVGMAGAASRGMSALHGDVDRHGRADGDALRDGDRGRRRAAGRGPVRRDRCSRRRRIGRGGAARHGSASRSPR